MCINMQFKPEEREEQLHCLQNYSQEEKSLLNSRRRMNCEASERSSEVDRNEEEEIIEFKREIQERFKLSIPNKLYTFPKRITSISDLLSSSDSEAEDPPPHHNHHVQQHARNFRKKSKPKESPSREMEKSYMVESVKKGKDKLKTTDSTNKGEREKMGSRLEKTQQGKKEKKRREPEPTPFLETIRHKMGKKN